MGDPPLYNSALLRRTCSGLRTLLSVLSPAVSVRIKMMQNPLAELERKLRGGSESFLPDQSLAILVFSPFTAFLE